VSDCIFCAVASGEAERSLVHEDDVLVVVMDIQPVNPGHALVLPKRHARYLADLDEDAAAQLFVGALRTAAALRRSGLRCEGVNLFVADGEAAGQEVAHAHMHVVPRFEGDPFRVGREGGWSEPPPRAELDGVAGQLRAGWGSSG
jgi:diadenosine tetraphosphate (Ap4A) HIT family hydrolase